MPRTRFHKLPPERQAAILDAAAEEFAFRGYEGASFNRIIENSGISKGSMYYYFEAKQDLYAAVLARMARNFFNFIGEFQLEPDASTFWQQAEKISLQSMEYYAQDPNATGLMRSLFAAQFSQEGQAAVKQMRLAVEAWWVQVLKKGQGCGAIRTDLPNSLMIRLLMAVCDVTDLWCAERIDQFSVEDMRLVSVTLINALRRIGSPEAADESCRHIWDRFKDEE